MALTQVQLETRITALRRARDSGVLMVRHGDEHTQFRNLAEMNSILADLEAELSAVTETPKPRLKYILQSTKGL